MRLTAQFFPAPSAPVIASFFAALKAPLGKPKPLLTPAAPQRQAPYSLPSRVRVALQAAARARR